MTAALRRMQARRVAPTSLALQYSGDPDEAAAGRGAALHSGPLSCAINLSRSRTHYAVLDILQAYKLSGNFHANLEIVLKDLGVFDNVMYEIETSSVLSWPDCRHVVFTLNDNVPDDMLADIIGAVKARIGFDEPVWGRLFHLIRPAPRPLPA